jgi:hypothetical protein
MARLNPLHCRRTGKRVAVEMPQSDAARAIQALNGFSMGGRPLRVNEAQDKPRTGGGGRPGGGGGYGRGGGGGGRGDGGGGGRW